MALNICEEKRNVTHIVRWHVHKGCSSSLLMAACMFLREKLMAGTSREFSSCNFHNKPLRYHHSHYLDHHYHLSFIGEETEAWRDYENCPSPSCLVKAGLEPRPSCSRGYVRNQQVRLLLPLDPHFGAQCRTVGYFNKLEKHIYVGSILCHFQTLSEMQKLPLPPIITSGYSDPK